MEINSQLLGKYSATPLENSLRGIREKIWFAGAESSTGRKFLRRSRQILQMIYDEDFRLRVIVSLLKSKHSGINAKDPDFGVVRVSGEASLVRFSPRPKPVLGIDRLPTDFVPFEEELLTRSMYSLFYGVVPEIDMKLTILCTIISAYNEPTKTLALTIESPTIEVREVVPY